MQIGSYKITPIETGDFKLDGGAMFGVVPKPLWNKVAPADDLNRIAMIARCLLIETKGRKILVDAGIGHKDDQKFREIFAVDFERNTLEHSLTALNIQREDITDLIYTHLHFDHAGGSTRLEGKEAVPTFPNARHFVQRKQYEHALTRSERDRASFMDANYEPVRQAGLLEFLDGDTEFLPGLDLLMTNGHTPGLQMVKISGGDHVLWYPTDLMPMSAHIPLPYIMGYDLLPVTTLADKKRLLPQAADEKWVTVFEHDPHVKACHVAVTDRGQFVEGNAVEIEN
jgi:glyoxylase-like metal-dependent hydrolase (beta-lactamase superfamily II)